MQWNAFPSGVPYFGDPLLGRFFTFDSPLVSCLVGAPSFTTSRLASVRVLWTTSRSLTPVPVPGPMLGTLMLFTDPEALGCVEGAMATRLGGLF